MVLPVILSIRRVNKLLNIIVTSIARLIVFSSFKPNLKLELDLKEA